MLEYISPHSLFMLMNLLRIRRIPNKTRQFKVFLDYQICFEWKIKHDISVPPILSTWIKKLPDYGTDADLLEFSSLVFVRVLLVPFISRSRHVLTSEWRSGKRKKNSFITNNNFWRWRVKNRSWFITRNKPRNNRGHCGAVPQADPEKGEGFFPNNFFKSQ